MKQYKPTVVECIQHALKSIGKDSSRKAAIEVLENVAKECAREHEIGDDGTVERQGDLIADIKKLQDEQAEDERLAYWTVR